MTTGEGIFWGLTFVGVIWLYTATKDRWKWKRIMKWIGVVLLIPALGFGGYLGYMSWEESRPKVETGLADVTIQATSEEVTYRKGKPDRVIEGDCKREHAPCPTWLYDAREKSVYIVRFRQGKVRFIENAAYPGSEHELVSLQGKSNYSTQEDVEEKFGKPDLVSVSANKERRLCSYGKYNVFFTFEKNKVVALGVFDPQHGPIEYRTEPGNTSPN